MAKLLSDILPTFENLTKRPENYLSAQDKIANDVTGLLKSLYDFTKTEENGSLDCGDALPELIVKGFDEEQIWQELELQNCGRSANIVADVASLVARRDHLAYSFGTNEDELSDDGDCKDAVNERDLEEDGLEEDEDDDIDLFADEKKPLEKKGRNSVSEVDDKFFKLSEMEEFLEHEERHETGKKDSDDESVDLFLASDDEWKEEDGSDTNLHYDGFFDPPDGEETVKKEKNKKSKGMKGEEKKETNIKKVRFIQEEKITVKSSLEERQERLQAHIKKLEEKALAEKPWQLKGEISAASRPQNSLLEEVLEYDLSSRPAPIITEKTTMHLEDVIKQRIRDKAWDDVERKVKPVETPNEYKKKLVLDQEKSKLSLAQVYEQEYMKQREAQQADGSESQQQEELPEHKEVRAMMNSLFAKLDALSNFHYTPRPPAPEVKIVSNLPAITMEEVAPVATTDAALLAPEEVKARPRGEVIGKGERTDTDRKRERRQKKLKQRERAREREKRERAVNKLRPGLGNKYSKERALRDLEKVTKDSNVTKMNEKDNPKSFKSSTAFFGRLQDEVKMNIKRRAAGDKTDRNKKIHPAKKFKL